MPIILGLMTWFKERERPGAWVVATYIAMLILSIAAGQLISRFYSEPLNRRLKAMGETGVVQ
jgi:hypothetical protein